jgi:membrane fusion protein, multidrug efflux system
MKLKRLTTLILLTSLGTALFAWSHVHAKAHRAAVSASRQLVHHDGTGLLLAGAIGPMITTPIMGRNLNLVVPLNTWVRRGDVIGTAVPQPPGEAGSAPQELQEAISAERRAQDRIRQIEEDLGTLRARVGSMDDREVLAETAAFDAERESEQRHTLLRSGFTPDLKYDEAATARDSAEAAVDSIRLNAAVSALAMDDWEAEAQDAQAELDQATMRRHAAEIVFAQMRGGAVDGPIVSPADGIIVAFRQPEGTRFGIASDPRQLCAYALVRQADLMGVRVGQQALIVLDARPDVTFHAKVSTISETPVNSAEGDSYEVAFVVDNPRGAWLSGAAMHARMAPSLR